MTKRYNDLSAVFLNCSLKPSREPSHTQRLMNVSNAIMEANGVTTQTLRLADLDIAPGVYPDMTDHGWDSDDWPDVQARVSAADILVLGTPIVAGRQMIDLYSCDRTPVWLFGQA